MLEVTHDVHIYIYLFVFFKLCTVVEFRDYDQSTCRGTLLSPSFLDTYSRCMWCGVRKKGGKAKKHCVPEVLSSEQASKRYSNEARCFGTRYCLDPEVVATCWSTEVWLVGNK